MCFCYITFYFLYIHKYFWIYIYFTSSLFLIVLVILMLKPISVTWRNKWFSLTFKSVNKDIREEEKENVKLFELIYRVHFWIELSFSWNCV